MLESQLVELQEQGTIFVVFVCWKFVVLDCKRGKSVLLSFVPPLCFFLFCELAGSVERVHSLEGQLQDLEAENSDLNGKCAFLTGLCPWGRESLCRETPSAIIFLWLPFVCFSSLLFLWILNPPSPLSINSGTPPRLGPREWAHGDGRGV